MNEPIANRKVSIIGKRKPPPFDPSKLDPRILIAAKQRNLVVFVGAGISRQAKNAKDGDFPNWSDLLQGLNDLCLSHEICTSAEAQEIDDIINQGEFLMAAQHLKGRLKNQFEKYLKAKFEPPNVQPGEIHDAIIRLNPPFVLTTNYDALLETALQKTHTVIESHVFTGERADLVLSKYKEAHNSTYPFIFKIHGSISEIDHLILTHNSYIRLYNRRDFQDILTSIFLNYVVLMIGFSLSDPEILHFLASLHARFNRRLPSSFIFTSNIVEDSVKAQRLEEDFSVKVIEYPRDEHSRVLDLINYLKEESLA